MSDKTLEDKAVEILDASQQALGAFADKMAELAKQYGPDVADAALQMARIDALNHLVPVIVAWIVLAISLKVCVIPLWKWAKDYKTKNNYSDGSEFIPSVLLWAVWGVCSAAVTIKLFDVWVWVGIFEPKLWIAKRILGL